MEESLKQKLWSKTKMLIKGAVIIALLLLFLIPAHHIKELVLEREARLDEAVKEVTSKWAGEQQVTGPVLVLPYMEVVGNGTTPIKRKAYVLPDSLNIISNIMPEKKHRGIYEVILFRAQVNIEGRFEQIPLEKLRMAPDQVVWEEAYVVFNLSDARGLTNDLILNWNGEKRTLQPGRAEDFRLKDVFVSPVRVDSSGAIQFSSTFDLKGSGKMMFTTLGNSNRVILHSNWKDPSFDGVDLPEYSLKEDGFTATWKTLSHGRSFTQAWKDQVFDLESVAVGTQLFIPVNSYQKTFRTVKYASLIILLTFVAFFLVETYTKKSVHPLHYALVGMALILFYTLLLSISEYMAFNLAYLLATTATVLLIGWFAWSILKSGKLGTMLATVLVLLYGYIFSILQLQDFSLLLGSIGLFVSLAVVMYFMRKLEW